MSYNWFKEMEDNFKKNKGFICPTCKKHFKDYMSMAQHYCEPAYKKSKGQK